MNYLAKYKKSDFVRLSWEDYGKTLEILKEKIQNFINRESITIDAVVPILRGGAFPGTYLAYQLNLLTVIPVQYKYFFERGTIVLKRICGIGKNQPLPDRSTFLLVENNHCFGKTAETAANDLKSEFPGSIIIYVADHMDYSFQHNTYADSIFFGSLTNETRKLTPEACTKLKINHNSYLFPWEQLEEEWITVQGKQFEYQDLQNVSAQATTKLEL